MNNITLRFADSSAEMAFVRERRDRLLANFSKCCAAAVVAGVATLLTNPHCTPWDCPPGHSVVGETIGAVAALSLLAGAVGVVTRIPCLAGRVGPVAWEAFITAMAIFSMVTQLFTNPFYWARIRGHSPRDVMGDKAFTSTSLVLFIDLVVTGSHLVLPIRSFILVPMEVVGVLLYVLTSLLVQGDPEWLQFSCFLLLLVALAAYGKRMIERQERSAFKAIIEEKTLRIQTEFQLSQATDRGPGLRPDDQPSQRTESEQSTTESGRVFARDFTLACDGADIDSLQAISDVGKREQWLVSRSEVELQPEEILGEGSFGRVIRGHYQGSPVAVKLPKVAADMQSRSHLIQLCNELRIMRRLRHARIVFLYGALVDAERGHLAIVLEMVDGVPLRKFIEPGRRREEGRGAPGDADRVRILIDVSCALWYIHTRQPAIVHGDLKDTNVFAVPGQAAGPCHAKLLDFGLARVITRNAKPLGGTLLWMAPEVIMGRNRRPSTAADVFSFGRLAFFVLTGTHPHSLMSQRSILEHARANRLPRMLWPRDNALAETFREVVTACFALDHAARPQIAELHRQFSAWAPQDPGGAKTGSGVENTQTKGILAAVRHLRGTAAGRRHAPEAEVLGAPAAACTNPGPQPRPQSGLSPADQQRPEGSPMPAQEPVAASPAAARGDDLRTRLPEFNPTPLKTQVHMLLESMARINAKVPRASCCFHHAGLALIREACNEIEQMECMDFGSAIGQCPECQALVLFGDLDAPQIACNCCGQQLDMSASDRSSV